jgi:hypothetical protein
MIAKALLSWATATKDEAKAKPRQGYDAPWRGLRARYAEGRSLHPSHLRSLSRTDSRPRARSRSRTRLGRRTVEGHSTHRSRFTLPCLTSPVRDHFCASPRLAVIPIPDSGTMKFSHWNHANLGLFQMQASSLGSTQPASAWLQRRHLHDWHGQGDRSCRYPPEHSLSRRSAQRREVVPSS